MLIPLKNYICDECGCTIEKPGDGWLEWIDDNKTPLKGFRIVHHSSASPRKNQGGNCYYPPNLDVSDDHLTHYMGTDGLAFLLSKFDQNLSDAKELVEIIRRLHIPHYEEARQFIDRAHKDGLLDSKDHDQNNLLMIIKQYAK